MQPGITVTLTAALKTGTEIGLACGTGKETFSKGAEVKAGSSGDDGQTGAVGYCMEGGAGLAAVIACGERLVWVGNVEEVVGQAGPIFRSWLGCAQVHAAIDGDRVATDNFAGKTLSKRKGKGGFAAARRAE
jgi:hypothetical protein